MPETEEERKLTCDGGKEKKKRPPHDNIASQRGDISIFHATNVLAPLFSLHYSQRLSSLSPFFSQEASRLLRT